MKSKFDVLFLPLKQDTYLMLITLAELVYECKIDEAGRRNLAAVVTEEAQHLRILILKRSMLQLQFVLAHVSN